MQNLPQGGLIGKTVAAARAIIRLRIPIYAANASFFMVLSVFPMLLLCCDTPVWRLMRWLPCWRG